MDQVTDPTLNHMLSYKSGMLQSWNKFCFTTGYIEVAVTLPGPNSNTQGYVGVIFLKFLERALIDFFTFFSPTYSQWPGVWTMGNLGRPGYGATTDGTWPYS